MSESNLFARGATAAIVAVSAIPAITAVSGYQGMTFAVNAKAAPPAALVIPHPLTLLTDTWLSTHRNLLNSNSTLRADFIALEVEVARGDSGDMRHTLRQWGDSLVEDGSLPAEGWELNLNPSNGDQFLTHTREIASALSEANAGTNTSCGMHCHVDARDFGWFDLFKLCRLYGKVEDGLFSLCSRSRQSNHYCMKCAETYSFEDYKTFKRDLIRKLYGWTPSKSKPCTCYGKTHRGAHKNGNYRGFQERDEKYNGARYHALNLHSFFYRQTVEFRHHHGTVDAKKMQGWGMVCASVMDSASRMTLAEIDALPSGSFDALLTILSPSLREWAASRAAELNNKRKRRIDLCVELQDSFVTRKKWTRARCPLPST